MNNEKKIILSTLLTLLCAVSFGGEKKFKTAKNVDINKYIGHWNSIASLPQFFTRKCIAQTAKYEILSETSISVLNTCIKEKGVHTTITGQAVVKDAPNNAVLEVTFNSFFTKFFRVKGDYVIFKIDSKYKYALVGSRNLKYLWLLSRKTKVPDEIYTEYISHAKELGFDVSKLINSKF